MKSLSEKLNTATETAMVEAGWRSYWRERALAAERKLNMTDYPFRVPRRYRQIHPLIIEKIKELKAKGHGRDYIAKVLGISSSSVRYHTNPEYREKQKELRAKKKRDMEYQRMRRRERRELEEPKKGTPMTTSELKAMRTDLLAGMTQTDIAKKYRRNVSTVRYHLLDKAKEQKRANNLRRYYKKKESVDAGPDKSS